MYYFIGRKINNIYYNYMKNTQKRIKKSIKRTLKNKKKNKNKRKNIKKYLGGALFDISETLHELDYLNSLLQKK